MYINFSFFNEKNMPNYFSISKKYCIFAKKKIDSLTMNQY